MRAAAIGAFGLGGLAACGTVLGLQPKATPAIVADAKAAEFELPAQDGTRVKLASALAAHDVVLVFYRGHW